MPPKTLTDVYSLREKAPRLDVDERGKPCAHYLSCFDLQAVSPSVRSSDAGYLGDPFRYYLSRRLGLSSITEHSEPLNIGTFVHKCF